MIFPWKSTLTIDKSRNTPVYLQIANQITKLIFNGNLSKGLKMPGSRALADELQVNRKTIIQAYEELIAQGWLFTDTSRGTFVSNKLPLLEARKLEATPPHEVKQDTIDHNNYNYIPSFKSQPKPFIEINDGSPDHRLAPIDWIYKECRSIARSNYGEHLLKYADVKGDITLRTELAQYLSETRGMPVTPENILITRGSQMGIFLLATTLLAPDKIAVVGNTSYDAADWTIQYSGAQLMRVTVDNEGLNTDELETLCKKQKVSLVYITPHHHFPTTVTLSNERRIKLLELSIKYNFLIIEDDYDYDFHYNSSPLLPLASLNLGAHVAYIGSFSKIYAPTIRVGYVAASPQLIESLSRARRIVDRQGDQILERVIAESIKSGELDRHLKKVIREYSHRKDHFHSLMMQHLKPHADFEMPEGGMAIWTIFKDQLKPQELLERANERGLHLNVDKKHVKEQNAMRLGFASLTPSEMDRAFDILKEII